MISYSFQRQLCEVSYAPNFSYLIFLSVSRFSSNWGLIFFLLFLKIQLTGSYMTYSMLYTFYYSRRVTCDMCFCSRIIWPFPLEPHFDVSSYDIACCPDFFRFKHLFLYSPCINCLSAHFLLFAAIASSSQVLLLLFPFCEVWIEGLSNFSISHSFGCFESEGLWVCLISQFSTVSVASGCCNSSFGAAIFRCSFFFFPSSILVCRLD